MPERPARSGPTGPLTVPRVDRTLASTTEVIG